MEGYRSRLRRTAFVEPDTPIGGIILWYGALEAKPARYRVCDGMCGTPDLRDKYIVGAGSSYNPGDNGGSNEHDHTINANSHSHHLPTPGTISTNNPVDDRFLSNEIITGTALEKNHRPPFRSLRYIMKVK